METDGSAKGTGCISSSGSWLNLFALELTIFFGQRSFENMVHNLLHSFAKPSLVEDRRYARLIVVLTKPFLYLLSTWLWKQNSCPLSVGFLQTSVVRVPSKMFLRCSFVIAYQKTFQNWWTNKTKEQLTLTHSMILYGVFEKKRNIDSL